MHSLTDAEVKELEELICSPSLIDLVNTSIPQWQSVQTFISLPYRWDVPPYLAYYQQPGGELITDVGAAVRKYLAIVNGDRAKFISLADEHYYAGTGVLNTIWLGTSAIARWDLRHVNRVTSAMAYHVHDCWEKMVMDCEDNSRCPDDHCVVHFVHESLPLVREVMEFYYAYDHCYAVVHGLNPRFYKAGKATPAHPSDHGAQSVAKTRVWPRHRAELLDIFDQLATNAHPNTGRTIIDAPADLRDAWIDYWCGNTHTPPDEQIRRLCAGNVLSYAIHQLGLTDQEQVGRVVVQTFDGWEAPKSSSIRNHFTGKGKKPRTDHLLYDRSTGRYHWVDKEDNPLSTSCDA